MGLWTSATLNRFVNIGGGDEEEDIYDYAEHVKKTYIDSPKSREIAKKYGVYLTTEIVDEYSAVLFLIHNKNSEVRNHFYEGELWDVPDVKDDDTFFQRTEEFAKEFLLAFPVWGKMNFSPVGKRFTAIS